MTKQSNNPLVSIIIPVYNGSNYLREAIDSALAQTYDNIEVLVINDGSNDHGATEKIAKSYGKKIRYYAKQNGGVATALNLGIEKMKGEYFSWLSHDDMYTPEKVAREVEVLAQLEDKKTILYSSCELVDEKGNMTGSTNRSHEFPIENFDYGYFALFKGLMNGCTMLIHREAFDKVGTFDSKYPTTQDYQLWYDFFKVYPVKFVNADLVKSRIHGEQGSVADSRHTKEADALWLRMLKEITPADVIGFSVNINAFYANVASHLSVSPLREAYEYAKSKVDENADLVSVILPTYNRDYCIEEAINSVNLQTYANYELIVVDDGSTDQTEAIVRKCVKRNKKIRYIKQSNQGVSSARNTGIQEANGAYIAFLDSDDLWTKDHLEAHVSVHKETDNCGLSYNNYKTEGPGSSNDNHSFYPVKYPEILFIGQSVITTPSVVVTSKILDRVGLFDTNMTVCEDLDLWRRIAKETTPKDIRRVLTIVNLRENHYSADEYIMHRYAFIKKACDGDTQMKRITIARLLIELWNVYFAAGANLAAIYENMEKAFKDYPFLHVYLRDKIGAGEFGYYLVDELPIDEKKAKREARKAFIKNGIRRYRELKSTQGISKATVKAARKVTRVAASKGKRVVAKWRK